MKKRDLGKEPPAGRAPGGTAPAPDPDGTDADPPLQFEEALTRLEGLVERLESGEMPLEETIETFEEGQGLLRVCSDLLARAELRVKEILRRADGEVEERDWEGQGDAGN